MWRMTTNPTPAQDVRKPRYHHGDLRDALIAASRHLLNEQGAENFSLADACRVAGVSTAAPYKHFRDKNEVLKELIIIGMDDLRVSGQQALQSFGPTTLAGMVAMGQNYVAFAKREPGLFRLMFGRNPVLKSDPAVDTCCKTCFGGVIQSVADFCAANRIDQDASTIAVELWTFVHGVASLAIDGDYDKVAPGLDTDALIAKTSPRLLYMDHA
jgi:AcrR family transcriptional regulator